MRTGGVYMRRGPVSRPRRRAFPLRIIIPLVFLIIGVGVAYSLIAGARTPAPRIDPVIIRPGSMPPITPDLGEMDIENGVIQVSSDIALDGIMAGPVDSSNTPSAATPEDQFSAARVSSYKVNSAPLKKTVDQYAKARSNQCSGQVTVQTEDTPLNVRSGPSTGNPVLTKAARGTKQSVLLWAPDSKNQSVRWFLLVDDQTKTVKGWVSGEYIDTASVVFAN
jgi:hypothetical protein